MNVVKFQNVKMNFVEKEVEVQQVEVGFVEIEVSFVVKLQEAKVVFEVEFQEAMVNLEKFQELKVNLVENFQLVFSKYYLNIIVPLKNLINPKCEKKTR